MRALLQARQASIAEQTAKTNALSDDKQKQLSAFQFGGQLPTANNGTPSAGDSAGTTIKWQPPTGGTQPAQPSATQDDPKKKKPQDGATAEADNGTGFPYA